MLTHPTYSAALACESLSCQSRRHVLAFCEEASCPHAWQRRGAEDRARRAEADSREARETHPPAPEPNTPHSLDPRNALLDGATGREIGAFCRMNDGKR